MKKKKSSRRWASCERALAPFRGTDPNLQREANALSAAIEGGPSGRAFGLRPARDTTVRRSSMLSTVQRVARALQVPIQELILKDAILDQDQPVPEQYRRQVEEYLRTLSEDLR